MAARDRLNRHRRKHDRSMFGVPLAMSAGPFGTYVFTDRPFDLDVQLFADVLADAMHQIAATGTAALVFRQIVFDWFTRQVGGQWLASGLASFRLAGRGQSGDGQRGLGTLIVLVAGFGPCHLLGFIKHAILAFFAFRCVTLGLQQADPFLKLLDALVQFVDVFRVVGYTRLEGVDIALNARRYVLEVGCILHALQGSEARRVVGLPKFVKGAPPVVYVQRTGLAGVLVMAHRMAAKRTRLRGRRWRSANARPTRASASAREIKELVETSTANVVNGSQHAKEAGAVMDKVLRAIQELSGIVFEIASGSNEQALGIEQVNVAVGQMDEVTQQNAALVEQAAAAAHSLQEQADILRNNVGAFRLSA
ncbi:hypothetical protein A9R05_41115 (plasmid) [Burkholderia sp. KK1]|nr:hypothetical protein A9R05_41115 [Burkholderia sp. KK1]